jgi:hypothetical protein
MRLRPSARDFLAQAALTFVGNALFPRLSYRLRWPTRLRGRRLLLYAAGSTAVGFWLREWMVPMAREAAEKVEGVKQQLRWELGREPTGNELRDRFGENLAWDVTPVRRWRAPRRRATTPQGGLPRPET